MSFYPVSRVMSLCRHYCVAACLLLSASVALAATTPIDHVVAVVNEDVIFSSQLQERLQMVYQQNAKQRDKLPSTDVLSKQVLEQLIIESLQLQIAQRASIKVSDAELQSAIESIARQNHLDVAGLEKSLANDGIIFDSFKRSIMQQMTIQRIQQAAVSKQIVITEQDITNFLNSEEGKQRSAAVYHLAHILIPVTAGTTDKTAEALARDIANTARNKDQDFAALARQYSKASDAASGGDLGWRKKADLPTLYASVVDQLAEGQVSDPVVAGGSIHILKMLEKQDGTNNWVQQSHVRHILVKPSVIRNDQQAQELLLDLRQKILAGTDFAELAKSYSEDYGSSLKGGDLGWVPPGQLPPQFEEVMNNIDINAVSMPVQTQFGWHILQVLERRNENMSTEMLRQAARNFLMKRRFEEELPRWLKQIRDEAYVEIKPEPDTAAPAAEAPAVETPATATTP